MTLNEKSFKELTSMISEVADKFFKAKNALIILGDEDSSLEYRQPYTLYLFKVSSAYRILSDREKNLINNEFFFQNYQHWWVGLYSKANFYRFKRKAMLKFLEAFYHG